MKISSINSTPYNSVNFCAKKTVINQPKNHSPIFEGANTAAGWFGFGVALDYVTRKCPQFFSTPFKNSLFINGIISAIAGTCVAIKSSKH